MDVGPKSPSFDGAACFDDHVAHEQTLPRDFQVAVQSPLTRYQKLSEEGNLLIFGSGNSMDLPGAKFAYYHINLLAYWGSVKSWSMIIRLSYNRVNTKSVLTINDVCPLATIFRGFDVAAEAV